MLRCSSSHKPTSRLPAQTRTCLISSSQTCLCLLDLGGCLGVYGERWLLDSQPEGERRTKAAGSFHLLIPELLTPSAACRLDLGLDHLQEEPQQELQADTFDLPARENDSLLLL